MPPTPARLPAAAAAGRPCPAPLPALCLINEGMAGSGKTTFMQRLNAHLHERKLPGYLINLDPAVSHLVRAHQLQHRSRCCRAAALPEQDSTACAAAWGPPLQLECQTLRIRGTAAPQVAVMQPPC